MPKSAILLHFSHLSSNSLLHYFPTFSPEYNSDIPQKISLKNYKKNYLKKSYLQQIGTKFKSIFGEAFYRLVVIDIYPSQKSLIVRSAILLDPNEENFRFATNMWFSNKGYVTLGKYPVMPDNIYLIGKYFLYKQCII